MRKAYQNNNGLVYKIICSFIENDFKSMSKEELDKYCNTILCIQHYTMWDEQHSRYKILVPSATENTYNLNSEVVKYLNLS